MPQIAATEATDGIQLLADMALCREEVFSCYQLGPLNYSFDEENDSLSPILDTFCNSGGSECILKMINFDVKQFQYMWTNFADFITSKYNVGRGRNLRFEERMFCLWC